MEVTATSRDQALDLLRGVLADDSQLRDFARDPAAWLARHDGVLEPEVRRALTATSMPGPDRADLQGIVNMGSNPVAVTAAAGAVASNGEPIATPADADIRCTEL